MKFTRLLVMLLAFILVFGTKITFAQDDEKQQEEMTDEQWQQQMTDLTAKKTELTAKLADLQKDKADLIAKLDAKKGEVKKAEDDYWTEVGGKDAYNNYKNDLDKLDRIIKNREGNKSDAEKKFAELSKSNLRCHPDFVTKYRLIKEGLANWKDISVPQYTVMKGDYLFVIAARKEVYNNHHMWPILWEANENGVLDAPRRIPRTIKNPNLIYPGQVLRVPQLTDVLMKSAAFERAKSWLDWRKTNRVRHHKPVIKKDEGKTEKKDEKKTEKKTEKKDDKKK